MIYVLVWKKSEDSQMGHAAMIVAGKPRFYVSWYPSQGVGASAVLQQEHCVNGKHYETLAAEIKAEHHGKSPDICTPPIRSLDEQRVRKAWNKVLQEKQWCLKKQNCSTVIYHLLRAGGAPSEEVVAGMTKQKKKLGKAVQFVETDHLEARIAGELAGAWTPVRVYNYANAVAQLS